MRIWAAAALLVLACGPARAQTLGTADLVARSAAEKTRQALADHSTGAIQITLYDGSRKPLAPGTETLVRLVRAADARQVYSDFVTEPNVLIEGLRWHDNFQDEYALVASPRGYTDAGLFPVRLSPGTVTVADVMVLPKRGRFDFSAASWSGLAGTRPELRALLSEGLSEQDARQRYETLMDAKPDALAALLNIATALSQVQLSGRDWLSYLKQLRWDGVDRYGISGWADAAVIPALSGGIAAGTLSKEKMEGVFHKGSTMSVKQAQFPAANVHFIVFGKSHRTIDGMDCVYVSAHVDAYRGAPHAGEVVKWLITGQLTDPRTVYRLRWTAARQVGAPEFDPGYTVR